MIQHTIWEALPPAQEIRCKKPPIYFHHPRRSSQHASHKRSQGAVSEGRKQKKRFWQEGKRKNPGHLRSDRYHSVLCAAGTECLKEESNKQQVASGSTKHYYYYVLIVGSTSSENDEMTTPRARVVLLYCLRSTLVASGLRKRKFAASSLLNILSAVYKGL